MSTMPAKTPSGSSKSKTSSTKSSSKVSAPPKIAVPKPVRYGQKPPEKEKSESALKRSKGEGKKKGKKEKSRGGLFGCCCKKKKVAPKPGKPSAKPTPETTSNPIVLPTPKPIKSITAKPPKPPKSVKKPKKLSTASKTPSTSSKSSSVTSSTKTTDQQRHVKRPMVSTPPTQSQRGKEELKRLEVLKMDSPEKKKGSKEDGKIKEKSRKSKESLKDGQGNSKGPKESSSQEQVTKSADNVYSPTSPTVDDSAKKLKEMTFTYVEEEKNGDVVEKTGIVKKEGTQVVKRVIDSPKEAEYKDTLTSTKTSLTDVISNKTEIKTPVQGPAVMTPNSKKLLDMVYEVMCDKNLLSQLYDKGKKGGKEQSQDVFREEVSQLLLEIIRYHNLHSDSDEDETPSKPTFNTLSILGKEKLAKSETDALEMLKKARPILAKMTTAERNAYISNVQDICGSSFRLRKYLAKKDAKRYDAPIREATYVMERAMRFHNKLRCLHQEIHQNSV